MVLFNELRFLRMDLGGEFLVALAGGGESCSKAVMTFDGLSSMESTPFVSTSLESTSFESTSLLDST